MATLTEAQVVTHHSFFSGVLKEVVAGRPLNDETMKALMIESSSRLRDWLVLKEVMGHSEVYALVISQYAISKASELPDLPALPPLDKDEEEGLNYLRSMEIPMLIRPLTKKIERKLGTTSEFFWRSLTAHLTSAFYMGRIYKDAPPIGWRRQANVITHNSFRNSELEDMHAGGIPADEETVQDLEMKTTHRIKDWLTTLEMLRDTKELNTLMTSYWAIYCHYWAE